MSAFYGRDAELRAFGDELANPRGSVILVVGQQSMGKTALIKECIEQAGHHHSLQCRAAWFSVTEGDTPELTMSLILSDAEGEAERQAGLLDVTDRGRRQLKAIFELLPKGEAITKLAATLKHNQKLHIREQLRAMLASLSKRLPADTRAIFIIEPRKYLGKGADDEWAIVLEDLPERIKFIIEQRPEDAIATGETFNSLPNLVRIPKDHLGVWSPDEVEKCLGDFMPPAGIRMADVRSVIANYDGHPFVITKALELITDGEPIANLPKHPKPRKFAELQWKRISDIHGDDAVSLLQAYSILEEAVPDDLALEVAGIAPATFETLIARPFVASLIPCQPRSTLRAIYHAVMAQYVRERCDATAATRAFHERAIKAYRDRLNHLPPDERAARRLALHIHDLEDDDTAFVMCFVDECGLKLIHLGAFSEFQALTQRALTMVEEESPAQAVLYGNLGLIMQTRGDLDEAERMYRKSLKISEKLGLLKGMAAAYGNLGLILRRRGDLDEAERMHRKALEINEKLGRLEGMAIQYGNLGLIMQTRGDLDGAERMHRKSLAIEEQLGRLEGMASDYGNLGLIMQDRGDLDEAERMHRKSLEIEEKLGRLEGMANQYGNLGSIAKQRGDLPAARELWTKSRDLFARVGIKHMVEQVQALLDSLPVE